jgi:two-component system OmpR family sensor kinase
VRRRSLRVQLALLGFLAIYVPVGVLFLVTVVTEERLVDRRDGVEVTADRTRGPSGWAVATVVVLAPAAAGLAWWWAGRAVRPIDRVRSVAEDIEASDLGRRIGLTAGPTEVVSLAASFDAMLERLEHAAQTQRALIEETSHELRTPLAVLATNADVLLRHPAPTLELYREGLERSRAVAARLERTIDDLLVDARGRARTLDRRTGDLVAVARGAIEEAAVLAAARDVAISVDAPPAMPCRLDEPSVARAIANLLDNAIRHAPAGSSVEVEVRAGDAEATVLVTDHGPGIPAGEREHVFERFWHGGAGAAGTGLGLPIARQIALAHGGDVTLRSPGPAGDGCTFALRLRR